MNKNKLIIIIFIVILLVILLLGGLSMIKKTVKKESLPVNNIDTILFDGNSADISITNSSTNEINIVQYSMKKVDKSFEYKTTIKDNVLQINDNSASVNWLLGIKGSAGISYEIQIPSNKTVNLEINNNKGNLNINTGLLNALNVNINDSDNIDMKSLNIGASSKIYTKIGNINIELDPNCNYTIDAKAPSGNTTINNKLNSDGVKLQIQSDQGNISVK